MAVTLNASSTAGLITTADTSTVLQFQSNGTTTATIDASGNFGLGVTPSAINQGKGLEIFQAGYGLWNGTASTYVMANAYFNSGFKYGVTGQQATTYYQYQGTHVWNTAASGTAGNAITFTQAMTLDASGNLGVGTTSPATKLEAAGTIRASRSGSSGTYIELFGGSGAADPYINVPSGFGIPFLVGGTERARIASGGEFLIGNTSVTATPARGFCFNNPAGDSYLTIGHPNGSASGNYYGLFNYNSSVVGSITQNGTTGVLYNTSSDYRLKNITGAVTSAEAKDFIMALQPKQGTWKADGSRFVGFVAHEFQEVSPSSVSGEKDAVDAEGNPKMQAMQASSPEVMANLIALVQEQQAIIESLTQRITALEGAQA